MGGGYVLPCLALVQGREGLLLAMHGVGARSDGLLLAMPGVGARGEMDYSLPLARLLIR